MGEKLVDPDLRFDSVVGEVPYELILLSVNGDLDWEKPS